MLKISLFFLCVPKNLYIGRLIFKLLPAVWGWFCAKQRITAMKLNKYSSTVANDPTRPAAQAMLHAIGLKKEGHSKEPFMMMYLHKAPHRPWWPRADKLREFAKKSFPEPETLLDNYANRGTASKTAEMNILKHMMYGHDSKIKPETIEKMGGFEKVSLYVREYAGSLYASYGHAKEQQKTEYEPTLDSINNFFCQKLVKNSNYSSYSRRRNKV